MRCQNSDQNRDFRKRVTSKRPDLLDNRQFGINPGPEGYAALSREENRLGAFHGVPVMLCTNPQSSADMPARHRYTT
jgi:hypothetical protein